jgi:hypothetical protein
VIALCGCALVVLTAAVRADGAPVVRAAQIHAVFASPTSCDVEAAFTIESDKPAAVPFSLQTFDGTRVDLSSANGAAVPASELQHVGTTTVWAAHPSGAGRVTTTLRYRATQSSEWAYRCPIWLPAIPTDGQPGTVRLQVEWPAGAVQTGSTLPPLSRTPAGGTSMLAHVPAFVRVPFVGAGESRSALTAWDVTRFMDVATVVTLLGASLVWLVVRQRRRRRTPAAARGS